MSGILKELDSDKKLDKFYSMSDEENKRYLKDILEYANSNRPEFIRYCHTIEPARFCNLSVIYEALAEDTDNWGDFFADEYRRIIEGAKKAKRPFEYITCLEDIAFVEERNKPFVDRIIRLLTNELESPLDALRHRAVWLLGDWIDDDNKNKYRNVLNKMKERLYDTNWKIRWITKLSLKDFNDFKEEDLKISSWDRIRGRYTLFFSNPFEILEK